MFTTRKQPAKPAPKPATMMIRSSGGMKLVYEQGRQIQLGPDPVEVPAHIGEAIVKRGKAVEA